MRQMAEHKPNVVTRGPEYDILTLNDRAVHR
jgi:hypothetical protein